MTQENLSVADRKKLNLRIAANKAAEKVANDSAYNYPIKAPNLHPSVVPSGTTPAVAMDDVSYAQFSQYAQVNGFPGYPYLASLATRAEYRAFASALATEITREGIELVSTGDSGEVHTEKIKRLNQELRRLGVMQVIQTAAEQDCLFGRAQILINLRGHDQTTPLVLSPVTVERDSLVGVKAIEAVWTTPAAYNALDPSAVDFYKPSMWFMVGQKIHASRLMTIITRPVPDILKAAFNFGGISLSQLAEPYVNNWLRTRQAVADLVNNFSITALATSMDQVLQGNDDGSDIFARADLFTKTRSNRGLMMLDKEREEIVQTNTPLGGLHELQSQAQEHLCSVSRIPAVKLLGISPSGLNASSDGEMRAWYDWVAAQQESYWRKPIETILKVMQLSLFGEIDNEIGFEFVSLYQIDPTAEAQIRLNDSSAASTYIAAGVISPEEERKRLAADKNSGYNGINTDLPVFTPPQEAPEGETDPIQEDAYDKSVSEAQHNAMEAAAHGKSTLGIPKEVGKEFVSKD
jgi:phage-related protein (TIGR01555 family)